jgi:hypothetical protein
MRQAISDEAKEEIEKVKREDVRESEKQRERE